MTSPRIADETKTTMHDLFARLAQAEIEIIEHCADGLEKGLPAAVIVAALRIHAESLKRFTGQLPTCPECGGELNVEEDVYEHNVFCSDYVHLIPEGEA